MAKERALDPETLVIAHADGPSGIAGVMGGADAEIGDETRDVVLEAASFDRGSVLRTTRRIGLRTEASNRFEKGVDPALAPIANRAAARLLVEIAGATLAPEPIDVHGDLPEPAWIALRPGRVLAVTGLDVGAEESAAILERLGFDVERREGLRARPPTWRALDVTREIDLVEEVARIHGLEHVPATLPSGARTGGLSMGQLVRRRLHEAMLGAGSTEVQTMSLVSADVGDDLGLAPDDARRAPVLLRNPLSSEHAALRTLLLPSLAAVAERNLSLGRPKLSITRSHKCIAADRGRVARRAVDARMSGRRARRVVLHREGDPHDRPRRSRHRPGGRPGAGRDTFLHPGRAARVLVGWKQGGLPGGAASDARRACRPRAGPAAAFELDVTGSSEQARQSLERRGRPAQAETLGERRVELPR